LKEILDLTNGKFLFKSAYSLNGKMVHEFVFENARIIVTEEQLEQMGYY
jgi:hypothetical protein